MPTRAETYPVSIRLERSQLERIDAAAAEAGLSRHQWCKIVLECAAGNSALLDALERVRDSRIG